MVPREVCFGGSSDPFTAAGTGAYKWNTTASCINQVSTAGPLVTVQMQSGCSRNKNVDHQCLCQPAINGESMYRRKQHFHGKWRHDIQMEYNDSINSCYDSHSYTGNGRQRL
ncbi:MAG: hypothetical protein IPO92_11475 [Saprospiraceae bacterium]|nr:hypothetical protein [Saprospiraceae bacterium]